MLHLVLCDDNMQHNATLQAMLGGIMEKHHLDGVISFIATTAGEISDYAGRHPSGNVYFLDLDLGAAADGLTAAQEIRRFDAQSYIVYISAHQEYMLDCYKTKASDFLVKPVTRDQLEQCLLGIFRDYSLQQNSGILQISVGSCTYHLPQREIFFFEKQREYIIVHHALGPLRWREGYASLHSRLLKQLFVQVHKGYIINKLCIHTYDAAKKQVRLTNGAIVPVSRGYRANMTQALAHAVENYDA